MAVRSRVLIALSIGMVLGGTIRADMMPVSPRDADPGILVCVTTSLGSANPSGPFDDPRTTDADLLPIGLSHDAPGWGPPATVIRTVQLTSDGQNSFGLCLYTLLSLGLCRSVPLVKRLPFGRVPPWYHGDGPVRVGECLAISTDGMCAAAVCCFVQPDFAAEDSLPRRRFHDVAGLWLDTQFTPAVLGARAPPVPSRRLPAA